MAKAFLTRIAAHYAPELQRNGCLEFDGVCPAPLQNEIHPIFALDRWCSGHDQSTRRFYHLMSPALRLASRFLTEECTLPWFHHVTGGKRKRGYYGQRGQERVYIDTTEYEFSLECRRETRHELMDMANVISFMFVPQKWREKETGYGTTWLDKRDIPWFNEYYTNDFPYIDRMYRGREYSGRQYPAIAMNASFRDFFMGAWQSMTPSQRYRNQFAFAVTLVHECCHAYWAWLGRHNSKKWDADEPFWALDQRKAELGYSWETITLGRIPDRLSDSPGSTHVLCSTYLRSFADSQQRNILRQQVVDSAGVRFGRVLNQGWPSWYPEQEFRGRTWFCEDGVAAHMNVLAVVHCIPMSWVMKWFSEEEWIKKNRHWSRYGEYSPPPLGPTFILIYERDNTGKAIVRMGTRAETDPYLQAVGTQTQQMALYGHGHYG